MTKISKENFIKDFHALLKKYKAIMMLGKKEHFISIQADKETIEILMKEICPSCRLIEREKNASKIVRTKG